MRSSASSRRASLFTLGIYVVIVLVVHEYLFDPELGDIENDDHSGTYEEANYIPGTGHALTRRLPHVLKGHDASGHQLHVDSGDDKKSSKTEKSARESGSLADKHYKEWAQACHTILDSDRDYVSYHEGVHCWNHCHNVMAIQNLDSWIGHAQAKLQATHLFQMLFPKFAHIPQFISSAFIYFCCSWLLVITMVGKNKLKDGSGQLLICVVLMVELVLGVGGFLMQAWFVLVLGTVVWAQSFATDAGLTELFLDPEYAWAAPWAEAVAWLRNDYVPSNIIFYLMFHTIMALSIVFSFRVTSKIADIVGKGGVTAVGGYAIFCGILSIVVALVLMAYQIFAHLLSSGTHGVNWSCSKSFSAARAGWLPKDFPYIAGVAYTVAAVVHGLMDQPASVSPSCKPDAREYAFGCIPHTVEAIMILMVKSASILVDVLLDCAQSIMFFCRGQPFFGAMNITGIIIQMVTLLCQAARGMAQDYTFLAALLQSDLIANFRSSLEAGMILLEFHEKAYREALGETFLSMSISISAFFTTHFRFTSDLHLMLLSLIMSFNSIRSGVAESHEIVVAENSLELAGQGLCCQILPRNHYYARLDYANSRHMSRIGMLRVSEAVVPVTTVAVMMASGSAKTTYFAMATLSAIYFFAWYLWNNGTLLLDTFAVAFRSIFFIEGDAGQPCLERMWRSFLFCVAFIFALMGCIIWASFWLTTPFLTFQICVFWNGSVTVPRALPRAREVPTPGEGSWLFTFFALAFPAHLFSLLDEFSNAFVVKVSYIFALWSILLGCSWYHPDLFNFQNVTSQIIQARASAFSTHWWHGTIQSVLMCFAVLCYFMMIGLVCNLRVLRTTWFQQLTDAAQQQSNDFQEFEERLPNMLETLYQKGLCSTRPSSFGYHFGNERVVADATLARLVAMKVLNQIFGPPNRRVLISVSIFPAMLEEFLSGLYTEDGQWHLTADHLPNFNNLPEACVLCVGGDLVPRKLFDQNMFGQPLPDTYDAGRMIASLSARLSSNGPAPIFLVFGCQASQMTDTMESKLRQRVKGDTRTQPSFKCLADHIKVWADEVALDLKSPSFRRIAASHLNEIEHVQDCLIRVIHHCRETCLWHYFIEDAHRYTIAPTNDEGEAMSPGQLTQQLLLSLADAVEAVPALGTVLQQSSCMPRRAEGADDESR